MSETATTGIHHVTAICGNVQRTVDFYVRVLGLRFVKRTVNFDDPSTYHLYFGDTTGSPGTALTFFGWKNLPPGRPGLGQAVTTAFKVPDGSLDEWIPRIRSWKEEFPAWAERLGPGDLEEPRVRFGRRVLEFVDPDGMGLALVEREAVDSDQQWTDGPVAPEMAIAGFHGVTLREAEETPTADVLRDVLGFERGSEEDAEESAGEGARDGAGSGSRIEYRPGRSEAPSESGGDLAALDSVVEIHVDPSAESSRTATGSVHHVAFRASDDEHQAALQARARGAGLGPTQVIDRYYFRSVYFREPGGVLFEVATDEPGFTRDQPPEELGRGFTLPPWLEPRRELIEANLDPIEPPDEEELE